MLFDAVGETARLLACGRAQEAVDTCARLIGTGRGGALVRAAHGRALVALGRAAEAVAALREACRLSPASVELVLAHGDALAATGELPEAISEMQLAARLAPDDARPQVQIARMWLEAGEVDKALGALEAALERADVDESDIAFIRQRAAQIGMSARADAGYVRHLFNQFAADYDERMQQRLGYAAPMILRQLAQMLIVPMRKLDVLDLGCGTGLAGLAFRDMVGTCTGLDLSARMLDKARATGVYTALHEGDVEEPPAAIAGPFDLVIAADVLVYLGRLDAVFKQVRARLHPDGLWLFTTERGDDQDFELGPKRRYRHSADYLTRLAEAHGFAVASLVECVCRHEAGQGVASWAAAFRAT